MLGVKRKGVMGKPCADVWRAAICNTPNCGLECLSRGKSSTQFNSGDMTFKVDCGVLNNKQGQKIGHIEVVQSITDMVQSQKEEAYLVQNISNVSQSFIVSSKQIADGSQTMAQNATMQTNAIDELFSSVTEIEDQTMKNAEMANKAASLANTIKQDAEKGNHQLDEMMSAVKEINAASQSISKVIKVIDDIAFQTNILALNAAVEAARAGQHGKGFAVVAEEVRNLASKSADAAKDTGNLIANSIEKAELGSRIAGETAASLAGIVDGINESEQIITEIARSSEKQSLGITQINKGINTVAQIVQQTSATAGESAATAEDMSEQTATLRNLLDNFQDGQNMPGTQDDILALM
jgi:methyl-accepting chemotaxis protein